MPDARLDASPTLLVEAIHAWRTWTLSGSRNGAEVCLLPIAGDGRPWPARSPASATCTRHRSHRVPQLDCSCGLHAMRDPDLLRRTRDPGALGSVALWGSVVEHAHGFRAEFGYPQRLRLRFLLSFFPLGTPPPPP